MIYCSSNHKAYAKLWNGSSNKMTILTMPSVHKHISCTNNGSNIYKTNNGESRPSKSSFS